MEDSLVRRLRQFQADEPGFPPLFTAAAEKIEGLQREILRCDDACYERDKEIARLRRRVTVLEQVIYEELHDSGCQDDANEMIADEINERLGAGHANQDHI
jgi:hypothetical protein